MSDDVMTMSEQELRLEIARLEGYQFYNRARSGDELMILPPGDDSAPNYWERVQGIERLAIVERTFREVPRWTGDLNAMAALEDALTPEEQLTYAVTLNRLVAKEHPNQFIDFALAHASPLDRARAWVAVRREKRTE